MTRTRSLPGIVGAAALVAVLLAGVLAGCSSDDPVADDTTTVPDEGAGSDPGGGDDPDGADDGADDAVFPDDQWETAEPADLGLDEEVLDQLAADAEAAGSTCLMVIRDGQVAGEWYWGNGAADEPQEVFSVTKSLTSTLVGLAAADGDLDLDDPAASYLPEWDGTDSEAVTVANLVANDSGREWSPGIDYVDMIQASDRSEFAVALGQDAAPGETWAYNNSAIQTLSEILQEATGQEPADYAAERLFEPLGMAQSSMTADGAGNTLTFMGMQSTCPDLARFGHLMLNAGRWDGEQVVTAEWVSEATGAPSTELNAAYGYLWWLNREGPIGGATQAVGADDDEAEEGQMVADAPEDMFWARGLGNQVVQVDPGSSTVVVRLGGASGPDDVSPFDTEAASRVVTEALVD